MRRGNVTIALLDASDGCWEHVLSTINHSFREDIAAMSSFYHIISTGLHSLNASTILLTLVTVVALQFLCQIIYYKFFHPLRHYPGPFWAGVTRLWSAWHYFRGTETKLLWQAVKKYGGHLGLSISDILNAA
jgi:hypothetical protein